MNGFPNREDAGRRLAAELQPYAAEHPIVLALPRGGVPVGYEIARALRAPLDVWVVRKIGVPWHPELGVGAVAEGGYVHLNQDILVHIGLSKKELAEATHREEHEVEQRVRRFRGDRPAPLLSHRTVILVDDGIATGGTVRAAIRSVRAQAPKKIILAVPVAALETLAALSTEVEQVVCLMTPSELHGIGLWYQDFRQIPDDEVVHVLDRARKEREATVVHGGSAARG
jgi:putative phosphoribosyl transferase